jgi:hypothetical protein
VTPLWRWIYLQVIQSTSLADPKPESLIVLERDSLCFPLMLTAVADLAQPGVLVTHSTAPYP